MFGNHILYNMILIFCNGPVSNCQMYFNNSINIHKEIIHKSFFYVKINTNISLNYYLINHLKKIKQNNEVKILRWYLFIKIRLYD